MAVNESGAIVITGASRGIGKAIALYFSRHTKHPLILIARSELKLAETAEQCRSEGSASIYYIAADLTDPEATDAITLPDAFQDVSVLINNAGGYLEKSLSETDHELFLQQIEQNIITSFNATKRFLPDIKNNLPGYIINICSRASLHGLARAGAYSAAKHGMLGFTRSLRQELKSEGIAVTAINLGATHSSSWENENINSDRLINPMDVAALIHQIIRLTPQTVVEEVTINPLIG